MRITHQTMRQFLLSTAAAAGLILVPTPAQADTSVSSGSTLSSADLSSAGSVTLSGGAVSFASSDNWSNTFVLSSSGTLTLNSYAPTLSGVISGTGTLAITGSGTLTLSGNNTYTGATTLTSATLVLTGSNKSTSYTVDSASTLQIGNGSTTGSISGSVTNSGAVVFNRSNDYVYSGVISGTGTVEIATGRVALTGTNTYTGLTTIDSGAKLYIGNAGTTGSVAGDIANNGTLYFNRSNSITYAGSITGTGTVEFINGTTILTGTSSYTGGTTIDSGAVLQLGNGSTSGMISGDITNNGWLVFDRSDDVSYSGVISGTGSVEQAGSGTLTLSGANSYTGSTVVYSGTLQAGATNTLSAPSTVTIYSGGTLDLAGYSNEIYALKGSGAVTLGSATLTIDHGGTYAGVISGTGSVSLTAGTLILTGTNSYTGDTTIASGATLSIGNAGTTGSMAGDIANNGTLYFNRSNSITYAGAITGTGTVEFASGTTVLTGTSSYTGGTTIDSGAVLQLGNGSTTGMINGNVTNNGWLVFDRSDDVSYSGVISGKGGVAQTGSGVLSLSGSNTYTGTTWIEAGTLRAGAANALSATSTVYIDSDGTLDLAGYANTIYALNGSGAVTLGSATLTIAHGGTYEGDISGTGGVTQTGGTLYLNGTNTYTGATTVSGGVLVVGDSDHTDAALAGSVTVASGAGLTGYGSIGGAVTNNGTVAPGGYGTLTIAGDYTQTSSATLEVAVSPTSSGTLAIGGTANLNGTLLLDFVDGSYSGENYTLLTAGTVSGTFSTIETTGLSDQYLYGLSYGSTSISLTVQSTSAGQIYSDLTTAIIDDAHTINGAVLDHTRAHGFGLSFWAQGIGGTSGYSENNVSGGFNNRWAGAIMGADYLDEDGISYGLAVSFRQSALNTSASSGSDARALTNALSLNATAGMPLLDGRLTGSFFYVSNDSSIQRDGTGTAVARPESTVLGGAAQFDYSFGDLMPQIRISYAHASRDGATESGSSANLAIASRSYDSLRGDFTLRYSHDFDLGDNAILTPDIKIGVEGEMMSSARKAYIQLSNSTAGWVVPDYVRPDKVAFITGLGATLHIDDQMAFFVRADGRTGAHSSAATLSLGGSYRF